MNQMPHFDEIRDASPASLYRLNNTLRSMYQRQMGTPQFQICQDNIYIYTDPNDARKQIRIGRYDGINYGLGFTSDGGMSWAQRMDHKGLTIEQGYITANMLAPNVGNQLVLTNNPTVRQAMGSVGGNNLLRNSSFEIERLQGWVMTNTGESPPMAVSNGRLGGTALAITGVLPLLKQMHQTVEGSFRQKLAATCYIKTSGLAAGSLMPYANLYIEAYDTNGESAVFSIPKVTSFADWTRQEIIIDPAQCGNGTIQRIVVACRVFNCTGTVYFDDLQLEEGEVATAWKPHAGEIKNASVVIDDNGIVLDTTGKLTAAAEQIVFNIKAQGSSNNVVSISQAGLYGDQISAMEGNFDNHWPLQNASIFTVSGGGSSSIIQNVINALGKHLAGDVQIYIRDGTYTGDFSIQGFHGMGQLSFYFNNVILKGRIYVIGNSSYINMSSEAEGKTLQVQLQAGSIYGITTQRNPGLVYMNGLQIHGMRNSNSRGVSAFSGSNISLYNCAVVGCDYGIFNDGSIVRASNCTGSNVAGTTVNTNGMYSSNNGLNLISGTGISGTNNLVGAHYIGTATPTNASFVAPAPPSFSTVTRNASYTMTYTVPNYWFDQNTAMMQYGWSMYNRRSVMWFSNMTGLDASKVVAAKLRFRRRDGGVSGGANIRLNSIVQAVQSNGSGTAMAAMTDHGIIGSAGRNTTYDWEIPVEAVQRLINNANGALVFAGSQAYECFFDGTAGTTPPMLTITLKA